MKNAILAILLAGAFAACQNQNSGTSSADTSQNSDAEVIEGTVNELPNPSDTDLEESLQAFRAKDNAKAAQYILRAIDEIKNETPSTLEPASQKLMDKNIAALQVLADRVKNGKVTDEFTLIELFGHVDMMIAHEYFLMAQVYAVKEPAKAEGWSQRAGNRIERAEKKLKGESQAECTSILTKVKTSLAKGDKKADAIGNAAGEHVEQLFAWLKTHAAKMGINPPPSTNL